MGITLSALSRYSGSSTDRPKLPFCGQLAPVKRINKTKSPTRDIHLIPHVDKYKNKLPNVFEAKLLADIREFL